MKKLLIAAAGRDRPGIVSGFTKVLFDLKCNLEDTTMTSLEDHFAMLFIVKAPKDLSTEELQHKLGIASGEFALQFSVHPIDTEFDHLVSCGTPWIVSVSGPDKTGIVFHVTQLLAQFNGNIRQLSSRRLEPSGVLMYSMNIEVEIPASVDSDHLIGALAELAKREELEIHAEPLDEFNL